jgi:hypothetical protein
MNNDAFEKKFWIGCAGRNGFEYQVAAHMIYEGEPDSELVEKGLAVTRAVHDRYASVKRNPFNEIECGDHYARSVASYGVFLAACGYEYHGPKGYLAFAPRVKPENFRAPFTTVEGWGTYPGSLNTPQFYETAPGKIRVFLFWRGGVPIDHGFPMFGKKFHWKTTPSWGGFLLPNCFPIKWLLIHRY